MNNELKNCTSTRILSRWSVKVQQGRRTVGGSQDSKISFPDPLLIVFDSPTGLYTSPAHLSQPTTPMSSARAAQPASQNQYGALPVIRQGQNGSVSTPTSALIIQTANWDHPQGNVYCKHASPQGECYHYDNMLVPVYLLPD